MIKIDSTILSGIIGVVGAISGAIIGGIISGKMSEKATNINIDAQNKVIQQGKELQAIRDKELLITSAKIIYLDILTALYQGFKVIKDTERPGVGIFPAMLPINNEYSKAIVLISNYMDAKELILINQVYGIIEKIRYDILNYDYATGSNQNVKIDYALLESEVFKGKYLEISQLEVNMITQDYLLDELSTDYKKIFEKLKKLSNIFQAPF